MANVVITGCSSGIGLETALVLARAGHHVHATMRNLDRGTKLKSAAEKEKLPISLSVLDVDSDESVRAFFTSIAEPVDVLVNNAGIEFHSSIEEMPIEQVVAMMNTNYFGTVRCIKAVLPQMRERRSGHIINISSVAGRFANPPLGAYGASKHAVEAISEALAAEVKPFNVRVAIVEPGIQDTRMAREIEKGALSIYPHARRFQGLFGASLENGIPPSVTAELIRDIIAADSWQLRYPSGADAGALLGWRGTMSDEQWVDWSAQDDDSWYSAVERDFGMNARH